MSGHNVDPHRETEISDAELREVLVPDPELMGSPEGDLRALNELRQAAVDARDQQRRTT